MGVAAMERSKKEPGAQRCLDQAGGSSNFSLSKVSHVSGISVDIYLFQDQHL